MRKFLFRRLMPMGVLFFKNLRYLTLLILLPISIILGITVFTVSQYISNEMEMYTTRSLNNYHQFSDSLFSRCNMQASNIINDEDADLFFLHNTDSPVYYNRRNLLKLISNTMKTDMSIHSVYLHALNSDQVYSSYGLSHRDSFHDPEALTNYDSHSQGARSWAITRQYSSDVPLITVYQLVGSLSSPKGMIIINIDLRKFGSQMSDLKGEYDSGLFLVDEAGTVLRNLFSQEDTAAPSAQLNLELIASGASSEEKHFLYQAAPLPYTNWSVVLAIPASVRNGKLLDILQPILLIMALTIMFILVLTLYISVKLYSPIRSIMETLIDAVPEHEALKEEHPEEEAFISSVILNTIDEKNLLGVELASQIQTLKKAQSIALQSQINPHFFYNTLDSINWTAMTLTNGQNEVSRMLTKLASMLRYSLEEVNTLVTFEKELAHAGDYLELQALCYGDRFRVEWNIPEEVFQYPIIKIVLQPILENALFHGIKPLPSRKKGIISISAAFTENEFLITIRDNGVGMTPEAVAALNQSFLSEDIRQKAHIGLMNVNQRIKLILGQAYGLSVSSALGVGTEVCCHLPLVNTLSTSHLN